VPFLYNAYGIEMAARTYFDKSADQLDVLESATLVGMLKGNSYYNPVLNPERALQRRNTVLAQMVKRGKLTRRGWPRCSKRPLRIDFERQTEPPARRRTLPSSCASWLIAWADRNDYSIYADGLVVRTTIDSACRQQANQAVTRQGNSLQNLADRPGARALGCGGRPRAGPGLRARIAGVRRRHRQGPDACPGAAGLLADKDFMRPAPGQDADAGGFPGHRPAQRPGARLGGQPRLRAGPFDHVQQARRQPGSTFKPFVYGEAFDRAPARPTTD
jgi:penicillin-binding protein 1A